MATRRRGRKIRKTRQRKQKGGYLPFCRYPNLQPDSGQQGMCYVNNGITTRIQVSNLLPPAGVILSNPQMLQSFVGGVFVWIILTARPTEIYFSALDPMRLAYAGQEYFACANPHERHPVIHHNHVAQGQEIHCGGLFYPKMEGGYLVLYINNESGHYKPAYECLDTQRESLPPKDSVTVFRSLGYNCKTEQREESSGGSSGGSSGSNMED